MNTLREAVGEYLALRRGLGFTRRDAGIGLADFVLFLEQRGAASITTALAWAWAPQPSSARPAAWARHLSDVRGFARSRRATDPRTEIPPWGLLPHRPQRARPSRSTAAAMQQWLDAALHLAPAGGLRAWTDPTRLGLLAVTGLRSSEALGLTREDVDWRAGVLPGRGTKFSNSRLVPRHASTQQVLAAYTCRRDACLAGTACGRLLWLQARHTAGRRGGPSALVCVVAADGLAWPRRQSWTTPARLPPSRCGPDGGAVGSRGGRSRGLPTDLVHILGAGAGA